MDENYLRPNDVAPANIIWVTVRRGITQLLGRNAKGSIKKADL